MIKVFERMGRAVHSGFGGWPFSIYPPMGINRCRPLMAAMSLFTMAKCTIFVSCAMNSKVKAFDFTRPEILKLSSTPLPNMVHKP
jgi:hypothetical protein